jgi:hypothetical protein
MAHAKGEVASVGELVAGELEIADMHRDAVHDRASPDPAAIEGPGFEADRDRTAMRAEADTVTLAQYDRRVVSSASLAGAFDDGLERREVAACRLSASPSSVERERSDSISLAFATAAWSANVCWSASSSGVNGCSRSRKTMSAPIAFLSRRSGAPLRVRAPPARAWGRPGQSDIDASSLSRSGMWIWRFSATTVPGMLRPPTRILERG